MHSRVRRNRKVHQWKLPEAGVRWSSGFSRCWTTDCKEISPPKGGTPIDSDSGAPPGSADEAQAQGFRTVEAIKVALHKQLEDLPEPQITHRF